MIKDIAIQNLRFDAFNPRLPLVYEQREDADIIEWMLEDASLLDLISSIANNGYFAGEPIVVVQTEGEDFIVIEGNRRLAAVKLLLNPQLATVKKNQILEIIKEREFQLLPTTLPCYLLSSREEADDYLGFRHVTGVKSWGALEKAKYTFKLYEDNKDKLQAPPSVIYKKLAKKIGSKGAYIQRMIVGYRLFQKIENAKFYGIPDLSEESFDFSLLTDAATKYSKLQSFLGIDLDSNNELENVDFQKLAELTHWLYAKNSENRTRVGESRNIRILNAIVEDSLALKYFRDGRTLEEASRLTSIVDDSFTDLITTALSNVRDALQYIALIKNAKGSDIDRLKELNQQIVFLYRTLENKQTTSELL